jgi:capsular polysaccharide export protein
MNAVGAIKRQQDEPFQGTPVAVSTSTTIAVQQRKIILLQGPVGPFFSNLGNHLLNRGFSVRHIVFNTADKLFVSKANTFRFTGDLDAWGNLFSRLLSEDPPEVIILFGSNRPAHRTARQIAASAGIPVISLEEGYLRSGYITCELGGNNQHSPMTGWTFRRGLSLAGQHAVQTAPPTGSSFVVMSLWGIIHYLTRDLMAKPSDEALFHRRKDGVASLSWQWCSHMTRRFLARGLEHRAVRRLRGIADYILVPLQMPTDSQMLVAARGWTTCHLIETCLQALTSAPADQRLVFKLHPLDTSGAAIRRAILKRVGELGLSRQRVQVLHTGRMGDLAHHANGMIVINSTSAFSALHHDTPVLVLGDAVYRHDTIVTTGTSAADVRDFFHQRQTKPRVMVDAFLADLKAQSLLPGDFYVARGRKVAIAGILAKLDAIRTGQPTPDKGQP